MTVPQLLINFKGKNEFRVQCGIVKNTKEPIPFWASFENMPCVGNIKHGPEIDHCRLGVEIETIINYFSDIKSSDK